MAQATLQIRDFDPRDCERVIALLSEDRSARYRAMKEAVFDWQFGANPHADGGTSFLVGSVDSQIVALLGFMPARVRYKGRSLTACWICDIYVSAQFRSHGFGTRMIIRALPRAPVILGFGISDMSDLIMDQGSTLCTDNRIAFLHVRERGLKGSLKNVHSRLIRWLDAREKPRRTLDVLPHDGEFGADVDALWQRSVAGYACIVERDAAMLNWKYARHPLYQYSAYAAREDGKLRGILVARHNSDTSVLADYCGPADDIAVMRKLVRAASADLSARGTRRIRCETTHPPLLVALAHCGFIMSRYRSRFRIRSNIPGDDQAQPGWFIMSGDSDGDLIDNASSASAVRSGVGPHDTAHTTA